MANTVIQLRKSSTPSATPADLANGEIAINYADGKLFYKDSSGSIQQISSGGNTFSTINAAGTLLVSDLPTDILNIVAGDNIEISADALTDTFTITANLSNVSGAASVTTSDTSPVSPSDGDLWYNTTIGKMLVYYDDGSSSQWVEATTGQIYSDALLVSAAFDKANTANVLAYGTGIGANAYSDSVGSSSNNFAGTMANAANAYAASLTPDLSPVFLVANAAFDKANAANVLACTAFDRANSKVASVTGTAGQIFSSGGTTPTLNLITTSVTSSTYGGSTQIPVIDIDSYGRITSASNVSVQGMDYAFANSVGTSTNNYTSATYAPSASPTFTGTVTFTANVLSQTLTDGASIAWDASLGQVATVTLGGNRALANATNLKVGTYILHVIQDGSGGRTLSFGSQYKWPGGVAPTMTTTIGARDVLSFVSDGTLMYGSFLPDVK